MRCLFISVAWQHIFKTSETIHTVLISAERYTSRILTQLVKHKNTLRAFKKRKKNKAVVHYLSNDVLHLLFPRYLCKNTTFSFYYGMKF